MTFTFRCRDGHLFQAEGKYSEFDQAKRCGVGGCRLPAYMLVTEIAGMFAPDSLTARVDRAIYATHNVTHTDSRMGGQIVARPNEHSGQCGCDCCKRHRKRAHRTETADKYKEVRL